MHLELYDRCARVPAPGRWREGARARRDYGGLSLSGRHDIDQFGAVDPGWQEKLGVSYDALMLPDTGERLTKSRFDELHASPKSHEVVISLNRQEVVDGVIANPLATIASDGELGHPRNAGTYCQILARYVRNLRTVSLMDAIRKMSLMPAQRLEKATDAARRKGRIQAGADADIVVFDPARVTDRATYEHPKHIACCPLNSRELT